MKKSKEASTRIPQEVIDKWSGTRIAIVDDRQEFADGIIDYLTYVVKLPDVTIHQFKSCESFLTYVNEYDACFLDGQLGPNKMQGPDSVKHIRAAKPSIIIIGLTDHEDLHQAFQEDEQVDFAVKKQEFQESIEKILELRNDLE